MSGYLLGTTYRGVVHFPSVVTYGQETRTLVALSCGQGAWSVSIAHHVNTMRGFKGARANYLSSLVCSLHESTERVRVLPASGRSVVLVDSQCDRGIRSLLWVRADGPRLRVMVRGISRKRLRHVCSIRFVGTDTRKPYEPPAIVEDLPLETTSLACGTGGMGKSDASHCTVINS